jgi:hypothetical protein
MSVSPASVERNVASLAPSYSALHHKPSMATMASADFCPSIATPLGIASLSADGQISQGKTRDLRPIYPPHLRPTSPGGIGLRVSLPPRPPDGRLLCGSCSSGRGFACSCLPTTPRDDAVAVRLEVPATKASRGLAPACHFPVRFRSPVIQRQFMALRAMPGAPTKGRARGPASYCTVLDQAEVSPDSKPSAKIVSVE